MPGRERIGNSEPWKAGLPDQKARIIETLSQYFNVFRPDGDYWVRFTYQNESGSHEGEVECECLY